jgi:hypothetical protein
MSQHASGKVTIAITRGNEVAITVDGDNGETLSFRLHPAAARDIADKIVMASDLCNEAPVRARRGKRTMDDGPT